MQETGGVTGRSVAFVTFGRQAHLHNVQFEILSQAQEAATGTSNSTSSRPVREEVVSPYIYNCYMKLIFPISPSDYFFSNWSGRSAVGGAGGRLLVLLL